MNKNEQQRAIMEGERNAASDGYFGARPHDEAPPHRRIFDAGFDRGWQAALAASQTCVTKPELPPLPTQSAWGFKGLSGHDPDDGHKQLIGVSVGRGGLDSQRREVALFTADQMREYGKACLMLGDNYDKN